MGSNQSHKVAFLLVPRVDEYAKNLDKELLEEPFGDAAMKDRMKTDGCLA